MSELETQSAATFPFFPPPQGSLSQSQIDDSSVTYSFRVPAPSVGTFPTHSIFSPSPISTFTEMDTELASSTIPGSLETPIDPEKPESPIFTYAPIIPTEESLNRGRLRIDDTEPSELPSEARDLKTEIKPSDLLQSLFPLQIESNDLGAPHNGPHQPSPQDKSLFQFSLNVNSTNGDDLQFDENSHWGDFTGLSETSSQFDLDRISRFSGFPTAQSMHSDAPGARISFSSLFETTPSHPERVKVFQPSTDRIIRSLNIDPHLTNNDNLSTAMSFSSQPYPSTISMASGFNESENVSLDSRSTHHQRKAQTDNRVSTPDSETSISFGTSFSPLQTGISFFTPNDHSNAVHTRTGSVRLPSATMPSPTSFVPSTHHSRVSSMTPTNAPVILQIPHTLTSPASPGIHVSPKQKDSLPLLIEQSPSSILYSPQLHLANVTTPPPPVKNSYNPLQVLTNISPQSPNNQLSEVSPSLTRIKLSTATHHNFPLNVPHQPQQTPPYTESTPFTVEPYKKSTPLFSAPPPPPSLVSSRKDKSTPPDTPNPNKQTEKKSEVVSTVQAQDGQIFKMVQSRTSDGVVSIKFGSIGSNKQPSTNTANDTGQGHVEQTHDPPTFVPASHQHLSPISLHPPSDSSTSHFSYQFRSISDHPVSFVPSTSAQFSQSQPALNVNTPFGKSLSEIKPFKPRWITQPPQKTESSQENG